MIKVLVTGGRDFTDRDCVARNLGPIFAENSNVVVIHGNARGADTLCAEFAKESGVPTIGFPADWKAYGKSAGPIRNSRMLRECPDLCVAFPGGDGTADMVAKCQKAGVNVVFAS